MRTIASIVVADLKKAVVVVVVADQKNRPSKLRAVVIMMIRLVGSVWSPE